MKGCAEFAAFIGFLIVGVAFALFVWLLFLALSLRVLHDWGMA